MKGSNFYICLAFCRGFLYSLVHYHQNATLAGECLRLVLLSVMLSFTRRHKSYRHSVLPGLCVSPTALWLAWSVNLKWKPKKIKNPWSQSRKICSYYCKWSWMNEKKKKNLQPNMGFLKKSFWATLSQWLAAKLRYSEHSSSLSVLVVCGWVGMSWAATPWWLCKSQVRCSPLCNVS